MRILLWSNAPWCNTGYGRVLREVIPFLKDDGHEVAVLANFGLEGAAIEWHDIPVFAHMGNGGASIAPTVCAVWNPDVILTLYDVWAFPDDIRQRIPKPWIAYAPLDGEPVPMRQLEFLRQAEWTLAHSQHAYKAYEEAGLNPGYAPFGLIDVFKPGNRHTARQNLNIEEDRYLVTVVAANKGFPPRKSWPEIFQAFKLFRDQHPHALLYCHTTKKPFGSREGIVMEELYSAVGIPGEAIAFPEQAALFIGVPDEQVAEIYQASDVLLLPSRGEGFGLPVAEAQACGCPVIASEWSAQTELVVNGALVKPHHKQWITPLKYWWAICDPLDIFEAMEALYYRDPEDADIQNVEGAEYFRNAYAWDVVYKKHWQPFIERVERELW